MYRSTLSLTSALDGGGWSTPRPGRFIPKKKPVPIEKEGRVSPRAVLDSCGKTHPQRIRSSDRPARSESLYRLSYPGST